MKDYITELQIKIKRFNFVSQYKVMIVMITLKNTTEKARKKIIFMLMIEAIKNLVSFVPLILASYNVENQKRYKN